MYPTDRQETSGEDGEASYLAWHCYECDHVVCVPESGSATVQEAEEIAQALEAQYKIEKGDEAYFEASEEPCSFLRL